MINRNSVFKNTQAKEKKRSDKYTKEKEKTLMENKGAR